MLKTAKIVSILFHAADRKSLKIQLSLVICQRPGINTHAAHRDWAIETKNGKFHYFRFLKLPISF